MLIKSEKYPSLLVVGVTRFKDGVAEVDDPALIERLREFASLGVVVPEQAEKPSAPPRRKSTK